MESIRGILLSVTFLIMGIFLVYQSLSHCGFNSRNWPKADGLIINIKTPGSINKSINYEYKVEDTIYSSKRVVCGNLGADIEDASKYFTGKKVVVFYNPSNPNIAVLEPGIPKNVFIEGLICISLGLFCAFFAFRYVRNHQGRIFAPW